MLTLLVGLLAIAGASAQSAFNFSTSTPTQCQDFTLNWDGGKAPFRLVGIPVNSGAYIDGQHMFNMSIPDPEGSPPWKHTFKLNQPTNSEFIFALYDSTGFKGANVLPVQKVQQSDDKSCLGKLGVDFALDFTFYLSAPDQAGVAMNRPAQCDAVTLRWNMDNKTLLPTFPVGAFGMIPGGEAWEIPVPDNTNGDKGVNWVVKVPAGTKMLLFMTDSGKFGIGGSTALYEVASSLQQDCMKEGVFTSTVVATSTSTSPSGSPTASATSSPSGSGGGGTSTGAIVGAVIGSVAALVLGFIAAFLYFRRKRRNQRTGGPIDLHDADDPDPMSEEGRHSAQMESLLGSMGSPGASRTRHSRISSGFDSFDGTHRQSMFSDSTDFPYPHVDPFPSSSTNPRDSMVTSSSSNHRFMSEKQQMAYSDRRRARHDSFAAGGGGRSPGPGSSYALSEYVDAGPVPEQMVALPPPSYDAVLRARNPDPETSSSDVPEPSSPAAPSTADPSTPKSPPQRYSAISGTDSSALRQSTHSTDTELPPGAAAGPSQPAAQSTTQQSTQQVAPGGAPPEKH